MSKLYCVENLKNGKRYIGYTSREDVQKRFREHCNPANIRNRLGYPLYEAINKYGKESFICYEIYEGEDALEKEDEFIQLMGDYNAIPGGNHPQVHWGRKHTEEEKRKMSETQKGRKLTEEHKAALRKPKSKPVWNKGLVFPKKPKIKKPKIKTNRSGELNPFFGKSHSIEVKNKISKANTGRKWNHSEEAKMKIKESWKKRKGLNV